VVESLIVALGILDTPIEYVFAISRLRAAKVLKVDIAMSRPDPVATRQDGLNGADGVLSLKEGDTYSGQWVSGAAR
jgi:hypothetical protein